MTVRRRRRLRTGLAIAAVALLGTDQLMNWLVLGDGWLAGNRLAPFDPPLFCQAQVDAVARLRREVEDGVVEDRPVRIDGELGWGHAPDSSAGQDRFDALGARIARAPAERERTPGRRRILAFGGSFTYGTEVDATASWPAQLEELRPDVEVLNFGVPGYGMDQAFLRWRRDGKELDADEVWLGFLPAAAGRNVNCYRPTESRWSVTVAFKPRFELDADGALQLVPNPAPTRADVVRLTSDSAAFVAAVGDHDLFVRRVRPAFLPTHSHWSHWTALGRLAWTALDRLDRDSNAWLRDPNSEVFRTTRAIAVAMHTAVAQRGQRLVLIVLPSKDDLADAARTGAPSWRALCDAWQADGIDVVDLSSVLTGQGALTDPSMWAAGGHYSPAGNRVVATALAAR